MTKRRLFQFACGAVGIAVALLAIDTMLSEDPEVDPEVDVTAKFAKLDVGVHIRVNELLKADIICLLPPDDQAVGHLHFNFPGKISLRDNDYDVTDSESRWHIIAVEDQKRQARILDVRRTEVELAINEFVCSRNLIVSLRRNENKRLVSVVEAEAL